MKLKKLSIATIRSWKPCYDPSKHLPEAFNGTVLDLLENKSIPFRDRLWCALRTSVVSEKLMRLFAIKAASTVEHLMKDPRSINALRVAERFLNDEATREELSVARRAYAAAYAAAARHAAYAYAAAARRRLRRLRRRRLRRRRRRRRRRLRRLRRRRRRRRRLAAAYAAAAAGRSKYQEKQIDLLVSLIVKGVETGDTVLEPEQKEAV
jgi:hypothetical protein